MSEIDDLKAKIEALNGAMVDLLKSRVEMAEEHKRAMAHLDQHCRALTAELEQERTLTAYLSEQVRRDHAEITRLRRLAGERT